MPKKLCAHLVLVLMVFCLLTIVSCEKKIIKSEPPMGSTYEDEKSLQAKQAAERAKRGELERQRAIEETTLKEERLKKEAAERAEEEKAARDMFVNEDIHFGFNESVLFPEAQEILRGKAKWLRDRPDVSVTIEGHCDERGTHEYNIALGERRAQSVKAFLINLGIVESLLKTISYGEERPVDPGHDEESWARNRRAHFVIK